MKTELSGSWSNIILQTIVDLTAFIEHLLQEQREQFQSITSEYQLLARTALQVSLDAVDAAARFISTAVVVLRAS